MFSYRRLSFASFLFLLFGIFSFPAHAASPAQDPYAHFFEQNFGDYQDELNNAKKEGKKGVLLMFVQDECPFCAKMKATVLNRPEVQAFYRKNFKIFEVDIYGSQNVKDFTGKDMPQRQFALMYRARLTPTFVFVGTDGKEMERYVGMADEPTFMALGRFVASGTYKQQNFINYKRTNLPNS